MAFPPVMSIGCLPLGGGWIGHSQNSTSSNPTSSGGDRGTSTPAFGGQRGINVYRLEWPLLQRHCRWQCIYPNCLDGQGLDYGFWVIPYGHPEVNVALQFLHFASQPEQQVRQTNYIGYGPLRRGAFRYVNPAIRPHLPTAPENTRNFFVKDPRWWSKNREAITARFNRWLSE